MLGDVDPLPGEHRRHPLAESADPCQIDEGRAAGGRDPLLGEIGEQAAGLEGKLGGPAGISREQVAQVQWPHGPGLLGHRLPLRQRRPSNAVHAFLHAIRSDKTVISSESPCGDVGAG